MSWVVIDFPERREVFIDDQSLGDNRDDSGQLCILPVGAGWHTFRLGGAPPCVPPVQTVNVPEAPTAAPFAVVFKA